MKKRRTAKKQSACKSPAVSSQQRLEIIADIPSRAEAALVTLLQARKSAQLFELDIWEFAVELSTLKDLGLTETDCRRLMCCEILEHASETSADGKSKRSFQRSSSLRFAEQSCFVVTESGVSLLNEIDLGLDASLLQSFQNRSLPRWDRDRHELLFGNKLVKRFKLRAKNQEAILDAFAEEDWPSRIDDPLSPRAGQDPKRRLHDTINALNRKQKEASIRFYGDGTGQGICWELGSSEQSN